MLTQLWKAAPEPYGPCHCGLRSPSNNGRPLPAHLIILDRTIAFRQLSGLLAAFQKTPLASARPCLHLATCGMEPRLRYHKYDSLFHDRVTPCNLMPSPLDSSSPAQGILHHRSNLQTRGTRASQLALRQRRARCRCSDVWQIISRRPVPTRKRTVHCLLCQRLCCGCT